MALFTALAIGLGVAGLGVAAYGAVQQMGALKDQQSYQQQMVAIQQQQEAERKKQLELDATRRKREIIRQSIIARSQALTAATAGGANGSSALAGAYGGVSGRTGVNELGVNQNAEIGRDMFGLNSQLAVAQGGYASAGSEAQMGGALVSLGGAVMNNASTISKIGGSIPSMFSNAFSFGTGPGSYGRAAA